MKAENYTPTETMRLNIEFADNGIILRNPDCEDEVTLALTLEKMTDGEGKMTDWHAKEYRAIGKKIYDWLDVVVPEHEDHWITTGVNLHIKAELTGRVM